MSETQCKVCGTADVHFLFSEASFGKAHGCYYCATCDLYQTLGDIAPVSPDYIGLEEKDLVDEHVYLQRAHKRPAFEQWLKAIRRLTPPFAPQRRSVLDIGCGVGGFLEFAASKGLQPYGFDASTAQARVARATFPNVRNSIGIDDYVAQLDHAPAFDYVTMWDVFEHIREPRSLLRSICPHMTPTGLLFVSVPSGATTRLKLIIAKMTGREPGLIPWEHVFYYTKRSLRNMFETNGFDVLSVDGVAPYVRSLSAHEVARRAAHRLLAATPWAFQISAFARPRIGP
jgi:SAM-dependent methyltransferase